MCNNNFSGSNTSEVVYQCEYTFRGQTNPGQFFLCPMSLLYMVPLFLHTLNYGLYVPYCRYEIVSGLARGWG